MKMAPRNAFDRDPRGTYRRMHAEIDRDVKAGYILPSEERRLRNAANLLYLQAKEKERHARASRTRG